MIDRGLDNLYKEFEEASKFSNTLCTDCELEEMFKETFKEYLTKRFQRHIREAVRTKIKPGNCIRTIPDENRLRNKSVNTVK
jgi:hypothetical protein